MNTSTLIHPHRSIPLATRMFNAGYTDIFVTDVDIALHNAVETVSYEYGYRPDLDSDAAWNTVLPVALAALANDFGYGLDELYAFL